MKTLLLCLFSFSAYASLLQYPEERTYTSTDRGYTQYGAPSIHQTGRYTLTFDDGPHPTRTAIVLDTLKKYNAKATFFVITTQINDSTFPLIKRMLDEGHIVASHGRSHDNSNKLTKDIWKARVKQSLLDLRKWYKKAGYVLEDVFYRFPYAAYGERTDYHHINALKEISQELFGENCIQFAFWDIDSGDWIPKMTGAEVSANFKASYEGGRFITYKTVRVDGKLTQVKVITKIDEPTKGGVVLQHDIQASTATGTEMLLKYAQENKIEIVRLDQVQEFSVSNKCKFLQ